MNPRVRFAPSPTGHLHVGGARTALFNWLFARAREGAFVLRIEDTDRDRSSERMTAAILDALGWLGLEPDEGPLHQADGLERHRADAARVLDSGAAYRCFCGAGAEGDESGAVGGCPGGCRARPPAEAIERAEAGEACAIRFRVPAGETAWEDAVHGAVSFPNEAIDDFVLLRTDGTPVYNLAVVSDDLEARITHVIRGDDHLSNTPKQLLLYRALGADPPRFAHVPMILGEDGSRLSKRHGAASVGAFREAGILPEAMVNFLALLGWSPGDEREVMTREELLDAFSLDGIVKKSAVFDREKLEWLNGRHIAASPPEELAEAVRPWLLERGVEPELLERERTRLLRVLEAVKNRPRTLAVLAEQTAPFFAEEISYAEEAVARFWHEPVEARERLEALRELFAGVDDWERTGLEEELRALAARRGEGAGALIHPLRVALMGVAVSPGIFEVLELMEKPRTLRRIDRARDRLGELATAG